MKDLLTILQSITPYGTKEGFDELCWTQLCNVISSEAADSWTANKRNQFALFFRLFPQSAAAVFTIRDALIRNNQVNLTPPLIEELEASIDTLIDFEAATDEKEINDLIDEYVGIITAEECWPLELAQMEFGACYFKIFFLTLLTLDIEKRTDRKSLFVIDKSDIYERRN